MNKELETEFSDLGNSLIERNAKTASMLSCIVRTKIYNGDYTFIFIFFLSKYIICIIQNFFSIFVPL